MLLSLHATLSDPGSPSESHHNDSPVLASGTLTPSPTASVAANGAESLRGGTSPLRPAMFSVYASPVLFAPDHPGLRNRRNTRYGLLVKLYPMGTYTPKEAPSCAWRTNAKVTCRQHCRAPNFEKPPVLMRSTAFQKTPRCWRSGVASCWVPVHAHIVLIQSPTQCVTPITTIAIRRCSPTIFQGGSPCDFAMI